MKLAAYVASGHRYWHEFTSEMNMLAQALTTYFRFSAGETITLLSHLWT